MTQAATADPAPASEPVPGSDEYNAMMAARFRSEGESTDTAEGGTPGDAPASAEVPAMPEGGVEKFYDAKTGTYNWEAHGKEAAYRAAQASKADNNKDALAPELEAEEAGEPSGDDNAEASDIVIRAGLDPQALEQEIIEKGAINDDARKALNKQGISNEMIDAFVAGHVSRINAARAEGLAYVGGEETWKEVQTWARKNLDATELNTFRDALKGNAWKLAVDGLKARMAAAKANGENPLTVGNQPGSQAPAGYTSRAQMQKDMSDPRYASDPAFQRQVMEKMRHATWADEGGSLF